MSTTIHINYAIIFHKLVTIVILTLIPVVLHYDSELSDFVHCPAEFGRLAVFGWSEESRANARWRYCLEELCAVRWSYGIVACRV